MLRALFFSMENVMQNNETPKIQRQFVADYEQAALQAYMMALGFKNLGFITELQFEGIVDTLNAAQHYEII